MQGLREQLVASRPRALAYRATLEGLPARVDGLEGRVASVRIHPVKGLGGLECEQARVERSGLVEAATGLMDRGALLAIARPAIAPDGSPTIGFGLSNRMEGALSLARASLQGGALVYEAEGLEPLRLDPAYLAPREGPLARVSIIDGNTIVEGVRDDGPLAAWVASLLRMHDRARRFDPDDAFVLLPRVGTVRPVATKHDAGQGARTRFSDGGQVLVASSSTLAWMNASLHAAGSRAIEMAAFRPNIVIDGWPANVEDVTGEVALGTTEAAARFFFASFCVRCDATRVDMRTGEKPDREPLAFLAHERPPRAGEPTTATFGVNAVARPDAHGRVIARGDPARILSERGP